MRIVPFAWPSSGSGCGVVDARLLAVADAQEPRAIGALLVVQAEIALSDLSVKGTCTGSHRNSDGGCDAGDWQLAREFLEIADDLRRKRIDCA